MDIKMYEKMKRKFGVVRLPKENISTVIQSNILYGDLYGFVNVETGKVIVPCKKYSQAHDFNEGRATVQDRVTGKWGVVNNEGKEIVPCIYESIRDYYNGIALGFDTVGNVDILNRLGETVVRRRFDYVYSQPDENGVVKAIGEGYAYLIQTGDTVCSLGRVEGGTKKGSQENESSADMEKMLTRLEMHRCTEDINEICLAEPEPDKRKVITDKKLFEKYVYTMGKEAEWELSRASSPEEEKKIVAKHKKISGKINLAARIVSAREQEDESKRVYLDRKSAEAKSAVKNLYKSIMDTNILDK